VTRKVGLLLGVSLLIWAAAAYPTWELGGEQQLLYSAVALVVCLLPTTLSMVWSEWALRKAPEQHLLTVLGGTGLRLFFVLGVSLALGSSLSYFRGGGFLLWVLAFYLLTLTLEVVLLVTGRPSPDNS
jgi:hypothetical protein